MSDIFAPPTAEELESFEKDEMFAPPTEAELVSMSEPGMVESIARGAGEGASFGFGSEIAGLQKALTGKELNPLTANPMISGTMAAQNLGKKLADVATTDKTLSDLFGELKKDYVAERDLMDAKNKAAEEANPLSYMAGDIGASIGTGLMAGGAGSIAALSSALGKKGLQTAATTGVKEALKTGSKEAIKKAKNEALLALMGIGGIEGSLHGLGRSEADLTQGEVGEAAFDTAVGGGIGLLAPVALKGVAKTGGLIDDQLSKIDAYTDVKKVAKEGAENIGTSFKDAAQNALKKLSGSAEDLKNKALEQEAKYAADLLNAQKLKATDLDQKALDFRKDLYESMNIVGEDLKAKDLEIDRFINTNPEARIRPNKTGLGISRFDFDPLDKDFKLIQSQLDKPKPLLDIIQSDIKSGGYLQVTDAIRDLNRLMEGASPNDIHFLKQLKNKIQGVVDSELSSLPGDGRKLYQDRMNIAGKYGKLADVRDTLGAGIWRDDSALSEATKLMANEAESAGKPLKRTLENVKAAGNQNVNIGSDELLEAGSEFNRFKINPELGEMGLGENEQLLKQFKQAFGAPKEFGMTGGFATSLENLSEGATGLTSGNKQEQIIDWIKKSYPEKADDLIKQLKDEAARLKTLESGLGKNSYAGQSKTNFLKGLIDPLAFGTGKVVEKFAPNAANTQRALTQPQYYKKTVQEFKNSQKNEGFSPENK